MRGSDYCTTTTETKGVKIVAVQPYTKAVTYTVPGEWIDFMAGNDVEAMDAMLTPYVWGTVAEARERIRIMTTINRFPYNRYETREGTVYAFTEDGTVQTVIFLERRERLARAIVRASRPQPAPLAWQGYSPTWDAGMAVDLYQDAATGMWCTLVRVWNTHTGYVSTNDTEWHDTYADAHTRYGTLCRHYNGFNGR